ncbi:HAD hydrolase-like protein [Secundilactobacillus folii]|uniref:HAD hydrolase-like protein n=1 Tax=Secundilactobacillus folii TaxID=2678357 RepID=A0A7X2XTZ6_9LACO|nr:HAD hydrolase-like protein [Secundilactobacillus folii]MTV81519.1 HAD hydrolase-like protein [Secundilactobacillus folii]
MNKQVFFDFDGTLADSERGIIISIKEMVKKLGLPQLSDAEYRTFIGPAMTANLKRAYPDLSEAKVAQGVAEYHRSYAQDGYAELDIYPGIQSALEQLKAEGFRLNIASAKPVDVLPQILDRFHLTNYFDGVYGATTDEKMRSRKADILAYGIAQSGADPKRSVMVGDRYTDINGGAENNVRTIGVSYGFGDAAELRASNASAIVAKPQEIPGAVDLLLNS